MIFKVSVIIDNGIRSERTFKSDTAVVNFLVTFMYEQSLSWDAYYKTDCGCGYHCEHIVLVSNGYAFLPYLFNKKRNKYTLTYRKYWDCDSSSFTCTFISNHFMFRTLLVTAMKKFIDQYINHLSTSDGLIKRTSNEFITILRDRCDEICEGMMIGDIVNLLS